MLEALRLSLKNQQEPFQSDSKKPRGAVAVLFKEEAEDLWLLMIKRGENPRDPWSGQMAFPGGHADAQDRTLLDTVAREALEEVGINIHDQEFLGCLHNVEPRNAPMLVTPFVFLISKEAHPTTSREAEEILWVPMSFLLNPKNVSSITVPIGHREILMGCYLYLDHTIWGMSFRIIREILSKTTSN
jgi:8-oxo-dGTP pyrophosphatase MutT (NUDIX family)